MNSSINADRMLDRLDRLVSIETPTGHREGIERAYDLVDSWLDTPSTSFGGVREAPRHVSWGSVEPGLPLLLGHIDTVLPLGTLDDRPFTVEGDIATGPGVFDMKAGIVVMIEALTASRHGDSVPLLITSDEEQGSVTSRALVEQFAQRTGRVLVAEPSLDGDVKIARRGGSIYRVDFAGRAAHAGLDPALGRNALVELARTVLDVQALTDTTAGTTVSPTVASAGSVTNVIPDTASLSIDVRAWSLAELERIDAVIQGFSDRGRDGITVVVEGGINRPPMDEAASEELLTLAQQVARDLQLPEVVGVSVGGASDANFTAAVGAQTLDGLGPLGGGAHAHHEWVSLSSMVERAHLLSELIDRIAGQAQRRE